jgi:hypothetical protein
MRLPEALQAASIGLYQAVTVVNHVANSTLFSAAWHFVFIRLRSTCVTAQARHATCNRQPKPGY